MAGTQPVSCSWRGNLTGHLSWGLGPTTGPAGLLGGGVGVLAEATTTFQEGGQAMKAQGFLESLWYFSLTRPHNTETGRLDS